MKKQGMLMEDDVMDQYEKEFQAMTEDDVRYYAKKMRESIIYSPFSYFGLYFVLILLSLLLNKLFDVMVVAIIDLAFTAIYFPLIFINLHFQLKKDDKALVLKYIDKMEGYLVEKADVNQTINHYQKNQKRKLIDILFGIIIWITVFIFIQSWREISSVILTAAILSSCLDIAWDQIKIHKMRKSIGKHSSPDHVFKK
jgi:hypothetical protein